MSSIPSSKPITNSLGGKSITGAPANNTVPVFNAASDSFVYATGTSIIVLDAEIVVVTDALGNLDSSSVTIAELAFLGGVTSSIQTQLDGKEPTLGFTPENIANKGILNGYASLDGSVLVPVAQIPIIGNAQISALDAAKLTGNLALARIADLLITPVKINQDGATNGQVLAWSTPNGKWEPLTVGAASLGDFEFLKQQIDLGDFMQARGTRAANSAGTIASVTPATGKTYYQIYSSFTIDNNSNNTNAGAELQNDGSIKESFTAFATSVGGNPISRNNNSDYFDVLVGNSSKLYRMNLNTFSTGQTGDLTAASLEGFLTDT